MTWLFAWQRNASPPRSHRGAGRRGGRLRCVPRVERLEDRNLLSFQLRFQEAGFADLVVTDNDANDTNPAVGAIGVTGVYGSFDVSGTAALSKPVVGGPNDAQLALNFSLRTQTGGTLTVAASDTDFATPAPAGNPLMLTSDLGGTVDQNGTLSAGAFADPANAQFGTGVAAPAQGPFGPPGFSDTTSVNFSRAAGPYSLTAQVVAAFRGSGLATGGQSLEVMPCTASLGDFVWLDRNANGIQDAGEPGIPGVTVRLLDQSGAVVAMTTTDQNGLYHFESLIPGTYRVQFVAPPPFVFSPPHQGGNPALDSDADLVTGVTGPVTLACGEENLAVDTGMYPVSFSPGPPPLAEVFNQSFPPGSPVPLSKVNLLSSNVMAWDASLEAPGVFVGGVYRNLLDRDPTPDELNAWVNALMDGATRAQVVDTLWHSPERFAREVDFFYASFLHRAESPGERAGWVNALLAGAGERDVLFGFLTSPEYNAAHPSDASFVDALYADVLKRFPDASGRAGWIQALQAGMSRAEVAQGFLTSPEAYTGLLQTYYQDFLHRPADPEGLASWLSGLRNGTQTIGSVAEALLASDEYFLDAVRASQP